MYWVYQGLCVCAAQLSLVILTVFLREILLIKGTCCIVVCGGWKRNGSYELCSHLKLLLVDVCLIDLICTV